MIQIVNEWIVKDGVIGTAHKNRHGEMVDFRPVLRKELVIRDRDGRFIGDLLDRRYGYSYGEKYEKDLFCSLIPAKGHKLQPNSVNGCRHQSFLLNCLGVEKYVSRIDYPQKGKHTFGFRYMFQFEEVIFFLEVEFAEYEWYDAQLKAEDEEQLRKRHREEDEFRARLPELEKEIRAFLETFTPEFSASELIQLRSDKIDTDTFYKEHVHPAVWNRFRHGSYLSNREEIVCDMQKRVLDQAEAQHEERKQAWLAKKK